ncbi:hypothetical protein DACRYDRAFT_13844 [Dacryopinax primogenitus]|uniref:Uncharacterized protein n=1 Tax=Dacryopinax primogenitus (strain DJM 731) TaxID=1858805 RepID=M5G8V8_DACPD|nr:uncharacterized protein DACRYDRAFT_13844 [Dacryopinax primogenitus]EJU04620.1 hypothetical protein DACRYDRAFT_13844 [Dacryopinax primogenitus]
MASQRLTLDRTQVHQTAEALIPIHTQLVNYATALTNLANSRKELVTALEAFSGMEHVCAEPLDTLKKALDIWQPARDADVRCAKKWVEECALMGDELQTWVENVHQQEKSYDALIVRTNAKIRHANQVYEDIMERTDSVAADCERRKYLDAIDRMGKVMNMATAAHSSSQTSQHDDSLASGCARVLKLAESEWSRIVESLPSMPDDRLATMVGECEDMDGPSMEDLSNGSSSTACDFDISALNEVNYQAPFQPCSSADLGIDGPISRCCHLQ